VQLRFRGRWQRLRGRRRRERLRFASEVRACLHVLAGLGSRQ
jgi:hypothetical protein